MSKRFLALLCVGLLALFVKSEYRCRVYCCMCFYISMAYIPE